MKTFLSIFICLTISMLQASGQQVHNNYWEFLLGGGMNVSSYHTPDEGKLFFGKGKETRQFQIRYSHFFNEHWGYTLGYNNTRTSSITHEENPLVSKGQPLSHDILGGNSYLGDGTDYNSLFAAASYRLFYKKFIFRPSIGVGYCILGMSPDSYSYYLKESGTNHMELYRYSIKDTNIQWLSVIASINCSLYFSRNCYFLLEGNFQWNPKKVTEKYIHRNYNTEEIIEEKDFKAGIGNLLNFCIGVGFSY